MPKAMIEGTVRSDGVTRLAPFAGGIGLGASPLGSLQTFATRVIRAALRGDFCRSGRLPLRVVVVVLGAVRGRGGAL